MLPRLSCRCPFPPSDSHIAGANMCPCDAGPIRAVLFLISAPSFSSPWTAWTAKAVLISTGGLNQWHYLTALTVIAAGALISVCGDWFSAPGSQSAFEGLPCLRAHEA